MKSIMKPGPGLIFALVVFLATARLSFHEFVFCHLFENETVHEHVDFSSCPKENSFHQEHHAEDCELCLLIKSSVVEGYFLEGFKYCNHSQNSFKYSWLDHLSVKEQEYTSLRGPPHV